MTQGPSKFSACRSDAGSYKTFSPASTNGLHILRPCLQRLPQMPISGVGTSALLWWHQNQL